ncbi:zinc ribbon domain-containing protein [Brevibacillus choshinensis]|uniref:Zinc ribbon domain-containing protein n=1 Tax=Brevibacillus choshinensis TaxID=54911 RepID=A0ABX7FLD5_BRECH|nr:zinc ribbon domain-containing protein [Brevibacillus choshinensis]QRG66504.1 zinc ribbon domain-containing protein [Brevibacillus choshinensis]
MKSIKPGRGPSAMGAAGSIVVSVFGIFWTVIAFSITRDAPFPIGFIFPAFGILFVAIGIFQAVYHYKNATSKQRMSLFDITDSREESDPLNLRFGEEAAQSMAEQEESDSKAFCPYCGAGVKRDFQYCSKCGKKL